MSGKSALVQLLPANPFRWSLFMSVKNVAPGQIANLPIATNPGNLPSNAPDLGGHPVNFGINYRQWGALVSQAWYTYLQGVSTAVLYLTEVVTIQ